MSTALTTEDIAQIVHEATRAYMRTVGGDAPAAWSKLAHADRDYVVAHVVAPIQANPTAPASELVTDWDAMTSDERRVVVLARAIVRALA